MLGGTFTRVFWLCGLVFGGIKALRTVMEGGSGGEVVATFVGAGLFFGLFMAVGLTALHRRRIRKMGLDPDTVGAAVDVHECITLPLRADQALALCRSAVKRVPGASGIQVNEASATVEARVRMTWISFGERIECRVTPSDGAAEVSIRSRPTLRTTIVDYGKNLENVRRIRAQLLAHTPGQAAPSG